MVELGIQPVVGVVAGLTLSGELGGHVIGIVRGCEIRLMARVTLGRHRLKFAGSRALVTAVAVDRGMGSGERETVVVLLNLLHRDLPAQNCVALLAVCSQLPPMDVGVAVLASLSHVGESRFDVALDAVYRPVHATQRIAGLIVIEFRNGANRLPGIGGMAVLARDIQVAVRAVRAPGSLSPTACCHSSKREQKHKNEIAPAPSARHGPAPDFSTQHKIKQR